MSKLQMQKLKHTLCLAAGLIWAQAAGASDFSPIRQPTDIQAAGAVQVAFTPGDDGVALIVQAIEGARKQVLVQAYSFTSRTIAQALIDARRRGLDVQLLADPKQAGAEDRRQKTEDRGQKNPPTIVCP